MHPMPSQRVRPSRNRDTPDRIAYFETSSFRPGCVGSCLGLNTTSAYPSLKRSARWLAMPSAVAGGNPSEFSSHSTVAQNRPEEARPRLFPVFGWPKNGVFRKLTAWASRRKRRRSLMLVFLARVTFHMPRPGPRTRSAPENEREVLRMTKAFRGRGGERAAWTRTAESRRGRSPGVF